MAIKSFTRSTIENNIFYRSMLAGNTAYSPSTDEDVLAEEILTSSQASVTFSGLDTLAAEYKHLQIRYTSRIDETVGGAGTFYVNVNSDTGSNYARHFLRGNGSTVISAALTSTSTPDIGYTAGAESASGVFGAGVIDILDAFETTKYTTMRSSSGLASGYKEVWLGSVLWMNTAALTSVSFETFGVWNFVSGSSFTLIGVK